MKDSEAALLFIFMACAYAVNYPLIKFALGMEPPMVVLFYRVSFALVSSIPFIAMNLRKFPTGLRDNLLVLLVSMFNIVGFMGLWFTGESMASAHLSSILVYTYPIFNVLFSVIFVGEKASAGTVAGMAIGFAGVILVAFSNLSFTGYLGIFLLVSAAISWTCGTVIFKRTVPHVDVRTVNALQYVYSVPVILVLALATGGSPVYGISLEFVGIGAYLGLVGTYLPYLVYLILFRNYNVTRISPFFFIIPAISIAFSVLFLHETIGLLTVAGFGIISLGIFLSNR